MMFVDGRARAAHAALGKWPFLRGPSQRREMQTDSTVCRKLAIRIRAPLQRCRSTEKSMPASQFAEKLRLEDFTAALKARSGVSLRASFSQEDPSKNERSMLKWKARTRGLDNQVRGGG